LFQTTKTTFLSRDQWVEVHDRVRELLALSKTKDFMKALKEAHIPVEEKPKTEEDDEPVVEQTQEEMLAALEFEHRFDTERSFFPSLSTFLERMDENLWKSYQKLASKSSGVDYLLRISDENKLLYLIDETMEFLKAFDLDMFRAKISLIKLNYLYYKNDSTYLKIRSRLEQQDRPDKAARLAAIYFLNTSVTEIEDIVQLVQAHGQPKMKVKATLLQVYHLALHNKVVIAKDLLKKTHIGEIITLQHVDNQILYNRAIA